jgi:hypothetical protein
LIKEFLENLKVLLCKNTHTHTLCGAEIMSECFLVFNYCMFTGGESSPHTLQDCFDHVDWDMCRIAPNNIDVYTDSVSEFISMCCTHSDH